MMMGQMGVAKAAERDSQRKRGEGQRLIHPAGTEGVTVQDFMLKRRKLRYGNAGQQNAEGGGEGISCGGAKRPGPVSDGQQKKGRPFDGGGVGAQG